MSLGEVRWVEEGAFGGSRYRVPGLQVRVNATHRQAPGTSALVGCIRRQAN